LRNPADRLEERRFQRLGGRAFTGVDTAYCALSCSASDDVIISPAISDTDAKAKFPKGFKMLKPYLRLTPQPNK
jgi:hypothetical protein